MFTINEKCKNQHLKHEKKKKKKKGYEGLVNFLQRVNNNAWISPPR